MKEEEEKWSLYIKPKTGLLEINYKELWDYRELVSLWSYRDMVSIYKQTVLGPLWFILQPLLMTVTYIIIFGRIAKLENGHTPALLFYLSGIVLWNYFQTNVVHISNTFHTNAPIMTKVYFPRLVIPISLILSNFYKSLVQLTLLAVIYVVYAVNGGLAAGIHPNIYMLFVPVLVMLLAGMSFGFGLIVSAMTIRYRDLILVISFAMNLVMFITPVVFSIKYLKTQGLLVSFLKVNPLSGIMETFRYAMFNEGYLSWGLIGYSAVATLVLIIIGVLAFNSVEKKFVDTI
jgi:lipopolysaccharide transport system permease protein